MRARGGGSRRQVREHLDGVRKPIAEALEEPSRIPHKSCPMDGCRKRHKIEVDALGDCLCVERSACIFKESLQTKGLARELETTAIDALKVCPWSKSVKQAGEK